MLIALFPLWSDMDCGDGEVATFLRVGPYLESQHVSDGVSQAKDTLNLENVLLMIMNIECRNISKVKCDISLRT